MTLGTFTGVLGVTFGLLGIHNFIRSAVVTLSDYSEQAIKDSLYHAKTGCILLSIGWGFLAVIPILMFLQRFFDVYSMFHP